jgi:hypothetical protein
VALPVALETSPKPSLPPAARRAAPETSNFFRIDRRALSRRFF